MTYEFRPSLKQHILLLIPFIIINGALTVGTVYMIGDHEVGPVMMWVLIAFFVIEVLPVLLLHIQYAIANGNAVLTIDADGRQLTYKKGELFLKYGFDDIASLRYYATHGHISKRGSSLWYTFDPYRFYKIEFRDQRVLYVTCLMMNDIENNFEQKLGISATWKFRVIPLLY